MAEMHDPANGLSTRAIRIGTAGWSIPRASATRFAVAGTHLQRYAAELNCAEINSSFYRPHAASTYARWRDSTPAHFQFAVKMPRTITHERKLRDVREPLAAFLAQTAGLAEKRGPILVQLPPSLAFEPPLVTAFLELLRELCDDGPVVCEPRHATWFTPGVDALLDEYRIARVAADPPRVPNAMTPAGWRGVTYFRLHGSPRTYWSRYEDPFLASLADSMRGLPAHEVWCIFDNTAAGFAIENARELQVLTSAF